MASFFCLFVSLEICVFIGLCSSLFLSLRNRIVRFSLKIFFPKDKSTTGYLCSLLQNITRFNFSNHPLIAKKFT